MKLRDSLEEFGRMKGANKDEKGKLFVTCNIIVTTLKFQILKSF